MKNRLFRNFILSFIGSRYSVYLQALFVLMCCFPIFVLELFSYNKVYRVETDVVMENKQSASVLAANIVHERLDAQVNLGISLATQPAFIEKIRNGEWESALAILTNIPKQFPFIERIFIYDPTGVIKATLPGNLAVIGESRAYKDWYKHISSHWQPYVSNIYQRGSKPVKNIISILVPIKDDGQVIGILQLEIPMGTFAEWVRGFDFKPGEFIYIIDQYGRAIYHPKYNAEKKIIDFSVVPMVQKLIHGEGGVGINYNVVEKEQRVVGFVPVQGYGWGVVVTQPVEEAFMLRDQSLNWLLFIYDIFFLLTFGMGMLVFYEVIERKKNEHKIRQLSQAVEQSPVSVMITNINGGIEYVNPKFSSLTGYIFWEVIGKSPQILKSGEHSPEFFKNLWDTILSGNEWRGDIHNKKKNGELYWESVSISPIKDAQGQITHFVAVMEDITKLKQAQEDLARSNKDLEQFAYVASHDLQEPLRMVASFCQKLEKKYKDQIDETGKEYIYFAVDGAQRMQALVDALLSYAKVGKKTVDIKPVDLNAVVEVIKHDLDMKIKEACATIKYDRLPVIMANNIQMHQLFQNLITNAIKFKGERPPIVEIKSKKENNGWSFVVSDNGIGIDERHFHKLFVIFQRLHDRGQYPGTGIGLALCKKIVENFGGQISVTSRVGEGTSFHFTINVREA